MTAQSSTSKQDCPDFWLTGCKCRGSHEPFVSHNLLYCLTELRKMPLEANRSSKPVKREAEVRTRRESKLSWLLLHVIRMHHSQYLSGLSRQEVHRALGSRVFLRALLCKHDLLNHRSCDWTQFSGSLPSLKGSYAPLCATNVVLSSPEIRLGVIVWIRNVPRLGGGVNMIKGVHYIHIYIYIYVWKSHNEPTHNC
jgi:hypothetical protein